MVSPRSDRNPVAGVLGLAIQSVRAAGPGAQGGLKCRVHSSVGMLPFNLLRNPRTMRSTSV